MTDKPAGHIPVLPQEVDELLSVKAGQTVVDVTIGLAGHARRFADSIGTSGLLIGMDVDTANLLKAKEVLADCSCEVRLLQGNFSELKTALSTLKVEKVDILFADLGVSSTQLDDPERGFSFQRDGPLDMRMDLRLKETAADLINRIKERDLSDLLYYNAQETSSRRISKAICYARRERRITSTQQLVDIIAYALHVNPASRRSKIHPATRTFQALRIAVNDELRCLDVLLESASDVLRPGGRFGVIAFHSLEDKPVKLDFRKRKSDGVYKVITPKPVVAGEDERRSNPRSRSAKLRVAERLPENVGG